MTARKHSANSMDLKALVAKDRDLMKALMKEALQEVLEAEMTELLGAGPHERQDGRQGYRAAPTAAHRESGEPLAIRDDGIDVAGGDGWRSGLA